jgi:hypothetical protein
MISVELIKIEMCIRLELVDVINLYNAKQSW